MKDNSYGFTKNFANVINKYSNIGNTGKANTSLSSHLDDPVATPISKVVKI
jgi:hypothetical protein